MIQILTLIAWLGLPQVQPVAGQPIVFAAEHNGVNTTHYRLYINNTVVLEVPVSQLNNGTITVSLPSGLEAGSYIARLSAVNITEEGTVEAKSTGLSFFVSSGTGSGEPRPLQPINLRILWSDTAPDPDPPVPTSACTLVSSGGLSSATSIQRQVQAQAGDLLIVHGRFPASSTAAIKTVTGGGTWKRVLRKQGSDGTMPVVVEFWWAEASGGTAIVDAAFTDSAAWSITRCSVAGVGSLTLVASDAYEQAVEDNFHPSAGPKGVSAQPGDIMFAGGVTVNTVGSEIKAAEGWTLNESASTRGLTQYRIPTEIVTNDRAIWWGLNVRPAVSAIMVFRRQQ